MRVTMPPSRARAASPTNASRSNSQSSEEFPEPQPAVHIPGARLDNIPPPLPPPRYNDDLDHGVDIAWNWANHHHSQRERQLAPIKPGSSLHGSSEVLGRRPSHDYEKDDDDAMDIDSDDYARRSSQVSTVRSPSLAEIRIVGPVPDFSRKSPSPNMVNQRLHGEVPMAQRNFDRSSHAYDQRLLSKIGKSNLPPRHHRSGSNESSSYGSKLSLQTKDSKVHFLSANDLPSVFDPVSKWIASPVSAGISPGARSSWRDYNMGPQSPSIDSVANPLVLDPELFVRPRTYVLPRTAGVEATSELAGAGGSSYQGTYDSTFYGEADSETVAPDGSDIFRNMNLGDAHEKRAGQRNSKQGMKRRAGSPPPDMARDDKSPSRGSLAAEGSHPKLYSTISARSPASKYYQPKHGSVSSVASSARHNSLASSVALSITGSSMTSMSSFEKLSPLDPASQPSYITSVQPLTSLATSIAPSRSQPSHYSLDTNPHVRKDFSQVAMTDPNLPPATRVGNFYICDCCPKKPKKFQKENELRVHQMEKQYTCQYCNNRFKNKNEAERHQNSLHLRRHSWSCAAISSYQAVFHPSSPPPSGQTTSSADLCGYCGEEFPNLPQPDWDRRIDHLTNVHKFGECNQAKKFYRADHFRQHLKHSHGGQSGKWTNILENVCLREEISQDAAGVSPTGSDSSPGRGHGGLADAPMGGVTIDEAHDET